MKSLKLAVGGALILAGSTMLSGVANAQFVTSCEEAGVDSLSTWVAFGPCRVGDKAFEWLSDTFQEEEDPSIDITVTEQDFSAFYGFQVSGLASIINSGANPLFRDLSYSVTIVDDPDTPDNDTLDNFFREVTSDSDCPGETPNRCLVTKEVFQANEDGTKGSQLLPTLTSVDGAPSGAVQINVLDQIQKLFVDDRFESTGGTLFSGTNTFTQALDVPEPATLGLLGFGIAGLGFMANRRRKRS